MLALPGVDVGRGLINDQQMIVSEHGPGQTDQLSLSYTVVTASFRDLAVQTSRQVRHHLLQFHL